MSGGQAVSRRLGALVFLAGLGCLATEIAASRLIAPTFGSSTVVWANLIGVVLASLALGYWLGGRIADRRPSAALLGWIVVSAGSLVAASPFLARPLLDLVGGRLDQASVGVAVGSFFAVILIFAPPVVLLGTVAPFSIRLSVVEVATAGAVAGRLYALSTLGSLLGTFLPALVAIPLIGTQRTLLAIAMLLAVAGSLLAGPRALVVVGAAVLLAAAPPGSVAANVLDQRESVYQSIRVVQRDDGSRVLELNEGIAVHSVWRAGTVLTGGEWDAPLAVPSLLGRPLRRVAILGNAGGTTARALGVYYPRADVVGVELDPQVTAVGRRWLGLGDNPRLTVVTEDARPFLRHDRSRFDLIVVDAYRQPYVPFYLATREFFRLVREHLAPGGIVMLNVATVPGDDRLVDGVAGTLATELPQVLRWPALRFNTFVVGLAQPLGRRVIDRRLSRGPPRLAALRALLASDAVSVSPSSRPWTDDRAPVEWATDRMILGYAAGGGRDSFDYLPTRP
jgi:predicted membrane-bound spermidine synthase